MQVMTKKISVAAIAAVMVLIAADLTVIAEARAPSGGRSFGRSPSMSRPPSSPPAPPSRPYSTDQSTRPGGPMGGTFDQARPSSPLGGSFARGLAGGVVGGLLGNMLFGGSAHGMGGGGIGGSGLGLFELLILGGIGFFLYKRFTRQKGDSPFRNAGQSPGGNMMNRLFSGIGGVSPPPPQPQPPSPSPFPSPPPSPVSPSPNPAEDPLVIGVREIWAVDDSFHPDAFKEIAQDLFFKIQAGWTRRETAVIQDFVGEQLLLEYGRQFAEMKQKGVINRLENIAVRKIDLVNAGVQNNELFVTVKFIANLLDYTVDEKSGNIVKGDNQNPVKFEEDWTFASPVGSRRWKLEGIEA